MSENKRVQKCPSHSTTQVDRCDVSLLTTTNQTIPDKSSHTAVVLFHVPSNKPPECRRRMSRRQIHCHWHSYLHGPSANMTGMLWKVLKKQEFQKKGNCSFGLTIKWTFLYFSFTGWQIIIHKQIVWTWQRPKHLRLFMSTVIVVIK